MSEPLRIVLVGLMGAGKSAVAARLAESLDAQVIDTDAAVERSTGSTVAELFEREGEASFRRQELAALKEALEAEGRTIIATGGGIVTTEEGRALLRAHHPVVFLDVSAAVAAKRVGDGASRPLLAGAPSERLEEMHEERLALYLEVADLRVDADPRGFGPVVAAILEGLELPA